MARRDNEEQGKIFVGGLSWETTQDGLLSYFSRFGEVVDSVVMCNETGRSRGFGFVTFRDPSCVATVLAGGPHQLDGRTVDPKSCNPRSANRAGGGGGGGGGSFGGRGGRTKGSTTKIFVGGLPATVTETDLHAFFSEYGKVTETLIMYDQEQRRSRGFGFVTFDSEDPVNQLTSQRYVDISGKQVECKRAEPKESRLPKVGGRGGGGGGWGGQQQQQWGWGSSNGGGNSGYQDDTYTNDTYTNATYTSYGGGGGGGGGYSNSWGNSQGNYGYGGAGDQSYNSYGSYGQQQASSYGPMRTSYGDGGYSATATAGGYNGASTNGMAAAPATGQADGSYHPYRR
ncbi:heterogeneous nuclear ribonucleoprotein 27C-like isoform X4 [Haemaphysalis longicornis]